MLGSFQMFKIMACLINGRRPAIWPHEYATVRGCQCVVSTSSITNVPAVVFRVSCSIGEVGDTKPSTRNHEPMKLDLSQPETVNQFAGDTKP